MKLDWRSRFLARIPYWASTSKCWLWRGATDTKGYGCLGYTGTTTRANRLAWLCFFGEIPSGLLVCHHCDNPRCCNPFHLFLGTVSDNAKDSVAKGRWNGRFNATGGPGTLPGRKKKRRKK